MNPLLKESKVLLLVCALLGVGDVVNPMDLLRGFSSSVVVKNV